MTRLERLGRDKHSSSLRKFVNYDREKFYNIGLRSGNLFGDNVLKLFIIAIYEGLIRLEFFPGRPLQPNIMFANKAGGYPSGAPPRCLSLGYSPVACTIKLLGS